ncbi:hypothetical protein PCC7418_3108 [Halothece sp. PCC 7418]|uniref:hypothetical protein n=1 Tax=Halothece sp. (strain PCC 7418) TaxID=65093 RepID=UPI0002A05FAF|nr:hypothetical protein [Halothece sp. PCC 7418]AFZ45230.1 hypothetical protein PCC7418_3108 [Halothece sp. PCC 7418]
MAKQQINFRIDQGLLQAIKDRAQKEGLPYTQWIRNACLSQLAVDPVITFDEEEMDVYAPTAIHYSESNIQYSATTLQDDLQDWEQTESEHHTIAIEDTLPKAPETLPPEESSLQTQINHLSNRLRWESRYRHALETQVYYLKTMLVETVTELEAKIAWIEQRSQERDQE